MINQVGLRRRVQKNVQKRACSYCDLVFNADRNKINLTQRRKTKVTTRKHYLSKPKCRVHGGEENIDLRKYLSGLRWGVGRNFTEEIIDLRKYLSGLRWGIGRDFAAEIDLRKYLSGLKWGVYREIVVQDDADLLQEGGDENVVEEKASEVDDGDEHVMDEVDENVVEEKASKPLNFDLNELPPAEDDD